MTMLYTEVDNDGAIQLLYHPNSSVQYTLTLLSAFDGHCLAHLVAYIPPYGSVGAS
jgi:hypothetical protein